MEIVDNILVFIFIYIKLEFIGNKKFKKKKFCINRESDFIILKYN